MLVEVMIKMKNIMNLSLKGLWFEEIE